jgi:hypothetical protein
MANEKEKLLSMFTELPSTRIFTRVAAPTTSDRQQIRISSSNKH